MTLRQKFILRNLALLVGLCLLGGVALWGLSALRNEVHRAVYVYEKLAAIEPAEVKLAMVQGRISSASPAEREQVRGDLDAAIAQLDKFAAPLPADSPDRDAEPEGYSEHKLTAAGVLARLRGVRAALDQPDVDLAAQSTEVATALRQLHDVVHACDELVRSAQSAARSHVRTTLLAVATLSGVIVVAAALLSFLQYRGIILPLHRLRKSVRRIAEGNFAERCDERIGARDFAELAREFNRMAGELDEFYKRLEQKVQQASKDLVRSERLASVGFLAAGVAHEINNPLNIISGYAELSLKRLRSDQDDEAMSEAEQSLQVIRDEAFRCKEITSKLLSLSRGGNGQHHRQPFSLAHVAEDVAGMLAGLKNYRDRRVELKMDHSESLTVVGSPDEMKQVILNLAVNALEAVNPGIGEVHIDGRRAGSWVELCVRDNGRGMSADVIDHVFEPFFSARPGAPGASREPGTGLGLSITHAIVQNHGGQIMAESEGPGRGSRFVVRLPAAANSSDSSR
jgi:signal transduction histidine kinase